MFRGAKKGHKVWCLLYGFGEIEEVFDENDFLYPISVKFDKHLTAEFTLEGKIIDNHINPVLFWFKLDLPNKTDYTGETTWS